MGLSDREKLRQRMLACRDQVLPALRREKSESIIERLWQVAEFSAATTVLVYVSFRSEVETISLIRKCLEKGKRVAVPLTDPLTMGLKPFAITRPEDDLEPGSYGILEPVPERAEEVAPSEIETVLVPGAVFDLRGDRLGYGGGCYDRFLDHDAPLAKRIGLAYELQVVDRVPALPHDKPLHVLVTEKRVIRFSGRRQGGEK